jgi:ABC-type transporter Mla MlaB component
VARTWQNTLKTQSEAVRRVDLTEVTSIDEAGKACLADLHRQGAQFITADCLIDAIVDEIIRTNGKQAVRERPVGPLSAHPKRP